MRLECSQLPDPSTRVSQVVVFVPLAREFIDYQDRLDSLRFVVSLLSGLALISG